MIVLTATDAHDRSINFARALTERGVRPGSRVAIVTPEQDPESRIPQGQAATVTLVLAILRMGAVPVMINALLTEAERDYIVSDARAALVITGADAMVTLEKEGSGPVPELADHPLGRPMHYTSGTTGRPKGVYAPLSESEARDWWLDEQQQWGFCESDLTLVHSPLCHSAPLRFALATIGAGGAVALAGRFDPTRISRAIQHLRPTTAFTVPTQLNLLIRRPGGLPRSTYRLLAHAGSSCPPSVKRAVHAWVGADRVWEFYGSTEGQFTSCRGTEWERHEGTVGRARPGRTITVDSDGTIWCEPPSFGRFEYWDDPQRTSQAWRVTPTGRAFTVGDVGHRDNEGYVYLNGRREDLIISGGVNVYPAEVEQVLSQCPGVHEVAVYAQPSDRWGQTVCVAYVGGATETDLRQWATANLAAFKRPKVWTRVQHLPRNTMGKVRYQDLPGRE